MGLGCKALLVAAALSCAAAPAFGAADATLTAVDYAWRANNTDATTLTIAPGQSVSFGYPAGMSAHNVKFTGRVPDCTGLSPTPRAPGWTTECTFTVADAYPFICILHPDMRGTVVVAAPTPSPTATPTATPDPATPGATPTPTPAPSASPTPSTKPAGLSLKLKSRQKGTRVRGSVQVAQAGSRLEVTVRSGHAKAGTWVKKSAAAGRASFSVTLNAKTRKALRAKHRLRLSVRVALTAPGARTLTTTATATVSL